MPRGNGTGPMGMGAMSGKGLGNCIVYGLPVLAGALMGMGFGRRRGNNGNNGNNGTRMGRRFFGNRASGQDQNNLEVLKEQAETLRQSLESVSKSIDELENK